MRIMPGYDGYKPQVAISGSNTVAVWYQSELCQDAYILDFGRPAYGPEMMFKIVFLRFLYDVSDLQVYQVDLSRSFVAVQGQRLWLGKARAGIRVRRIVSSFGDWNRLISAASYFAVQLQRRKPPRPEALNPR